MKEFSEKSCDRNRGKESRIQCPTRHIIGHFGNEAVTGMYMLATKDRYGKMWYLVRAHSLKETTSLFRYKIYHLGHE